MQKHYSRRRHRSSSRRFRRYAIAMFIFAALLFIVCSVLLMYSVTTRAGASAANGPSRQIHVATPTGDTSVATTPVAKPTMSNKLQQATPTQAASSSSTVSATPTLASSSPQTVQTGVFPLSAGGPIPVSESILHPTNIARTTLNGSLVSVYAGSLAADPQQGVLCVLRENLTTGQFNIQAYQSPRRDGALTIVAIQNSTLTITDSQGQGTFDLATNQFRW